MSDQNSNDPNPHVLLSIDAEYLHQYIQISDKFIDSGISLRNANEQLTNLNLEFKDRISPKIFKSEVFSGPVWMLDREEFESNEEFENCDPRERDGWMPSSIIC